MAEAQAKEDERPVKADCPLKNKETEDHKNKPCGVFEECTEASDQGGRDELVTLHSMSSKPHAFPLLRTFLEELDPLASGPIRESLTAIVQKIKNYENKHRVYPALIILGGLADSGKSKFLKHLQFDPSTVHDDVSFSQSLIISNDFKSLFRQHFCNTSIAVRDSEIFLFYCLISGIHNVYKSTNVTVTATSEELETTDFFKDPTLQNGIKCFYNRKDKYQNIHMTQNYDAVSLSQLKNESTSQQDVFADLNNSWPAEKGVTEQPVKHKRFVAEQEDDGVPVPESESAKDASVSEQIKTSDADEEERRMWRALNKLEGNIHNGIAMSRLWELTINRTSLRFLECFRGHLYNSHIWLFMNLDRDLDRLFEPPEPRPDGVHQHAMKWRSRLHYLLRSCCLADDTYCQNKAKRTPVCRIFAIYKDCEEKELERKVERFKEEAEIAAKQYGFSDMIDFSEIVKLKEEEDEKEAKSQAYNFFTSYLRTLPHREVPLSWTFLRLVLDLYADSAVFLEYSTIVELAKNISESFNVDEFLKYHTSFGSILNVKLVNSDSDWVILQPDVFLKTLCKSLLSEHTANVEVSVQLQHGIITPAGVSRLFDKDGEKYIDVLVSLGLVTKMKTAQLSCEMQQKCKIQSEEEIEFVYFMSIIRQDDPDIDNKEEAIQLICGLKSAEMNMQVSFTRELQSQVAADHSPTRLGNVLLAPCTKVNRTELEIRRGPQMVAKVYFIVQGDIIEIRLDRGVSSQVEIDHVCKQILIAIQKICKQRANRGGRFDYHLRTLMCSADVSQDKQPIEETALANFGNYRILEITAENNSNDEQLSSIPLSFQKALQNLARENPCDYECYKSPEKSIITADRLYSLAKEVKDKSDVELLSRVLDPSTLIECHSIVALRRKYKSIEDDDPIWFTAFEILLAWRYRNKESNAQSKHNLALALIRGAGNFESDSNKVLKVLVRNLDTQMYFKALKVLSESRRQSDYGAHEGIQISEGQNHLGGSKMVAPPIIKDADNIDSTS